MAQFTPRNTSAGLRALPLLVGGLSWLTAVGLLLSGMDVTAAGIRTAFGLSGALLFLGFWRLSRGCTSRLCSVGLAGLAASALATGMGFAAGQYWGFLISYAGLLFALPLCLAATAIGLRRERTLPAAAAWVPASVASAGAVTYGFHALAPTVWDPHDAVWLTIVGAGWVVLGALLRPRLVAVVSDQHVS